MPVSKMDQHECRTQTQFCAGGLISTAVILSKLYAGRSKINDHQQEGRSLNIPWLVKSMQGEKQKEKGRGGYGVRIGTSVLDLLQFQVLS